ncbi:site-specific integrase [Sphingomonas glacialis]|nr:site-specific integrase [Sphingomonas glacialis]
MNLNSYLHKRDHSQAWQLRWMVPKAARPLIGKAEFTKSLRVTDRAEAEGLAYRQLAEWKAQVEHALMNGKAGPPVAAPRSATPAPKSPAEIEQAAVAIGFELASVKASALIAAKAKSESSYDALYAKFDEWHRKSIRDLNAGNSSYWAERIRQLYRRRGWPLDETSIEFALFVRTMAHAGIDTFAQAKAKMDGTANAFEPSPIVRDTIAAKQSRAKDGETVLDLFERYAATRLAEGRKRTDTINQDRKVISLFSSFVGSQRSLRSILPSEVRDWRNAIASLPPAYRKRAANSGLSVREASDRARETGEKGISPSTVNKYMSTVSPLFDWAKREGYVDRNPCDGLFLDLQRGKKSGRNRRPPFSVEQLNQILKSPLFTGFAKDGKEWQPGPQRAYDWRYWIPLICLFTGARIGEIAQLRVDDVRDDGGIAFLWIKDDDATGQTTKSGHCRPSPIHTKLQFLGFLQYVDRQRERAREDGDTRLFPELRPNGRGQISWVPSRFWRTYLTGIGVKSGGDGYGAHSFRHGLADQLRLAGYLDDEIEVALGHNQVSVTGGYGQVRQGTVARISAMLEKVEFKGVLFDHLIPPTTVNSEQTH